MDVLKGRTNRATYWFSIAILAVLMAVIGQFAANPPHASEFLVVLLCVPRLHDIGRTGWWVGLMIPLELVALAGMLLMPEETGMALAGGVSLVILLLVLGLGFIRGEPVANP